MLYYCVLLAQFGNKLVPIKRPIMYRSGTAKISIASITAEWHPGNTGKYLSVSDCHILKDVKFVLSIGAWGSGKQQRCQGLESLGDLKPQIQPRALTAKQGGSGYHF